MPTHYWIASAPSNKLAPGQCRPDAWASNQTVDYYCSRWEWDASCEPFSAATIQRFAAGFKACLQRVGAGAALGWCAVRANRSRPLVALRRMRLTRAQ